MSSTGPPPEPRATDPGLHVEIAAALRYVLHIESQLALATLALAVSVFEWLATLPYSLPELGFGLARVLPPIYFFLSLRKVASGRLRLPRWGDYRDSWDTLVHPLLQLAVVGALFWALVAGLVALTTGGAAFLWRYELRPLSLLRRGDPLSYPVLLLLILELPPALIAAATTRWLSRLVNPLATWRLCGRASASFATLSLGLSLLTVVCFAADSLGALVEGALPIPMVSRVLRHLLVLWAPMTQAILIARFIRREAAVLRKGGGESWQRSLSSKGTE